MGSTSGEHNTHILSVNILSITHSQHNTEQASDMLTLSVMGTEDSESTVSKATLGIPCHAGLCFNGAITKGNGVLL